MGIPFLSKKNTQLLTLDVGSSGTKLALRCPSDSDGKEKAKVWHFPHALHANQPKEKQAFLQFLRKNKLQGYATAVAIEDPSLRIRRVDLPKMPAGDLEEAVRWQVRDIVDGGLAENSVRHVVIDEYGAGEGKRLAIVAYAVRKSVVAQWMEFLKSVGLRPVAVEPATVSIASAFDRTCATKPDDYYGIVHLGDSHATFLVMHRHKLYFSRPMAGVSGQGLLEALEKDANISRQEALRVRDGFFGGRMDGYEEIFSAYATKVAVEIQRSIDGFSLLFKVDRIQQVVLTGGGASLSQLAEKLGDTLGIATSVMDVSQGFTLQGAPVEREKIFDVALGLSLYPL